MCSSGLPLAHLCIGSSARPSARSVFCLSICSSSLPLVRLLVGSSACPSARRVFRLSVSSGLPRGSWRLPEAPGGSPGGPPAPELDVRSILGIMLIPFLDSPDLKKQDFRMESVAFFVQKSKGFEKTPKKRNLTNEEREAREKREPQASQATENTRR